MAAKHNRVFIEAVGDNYAWVRKSNNSATIAESHRTWDTPGLATKNALAVNRPPFLLVSPKEIRTVTE